MFLSSILIEISRIKENAMRKVAGRPVLRAATPRRAAGAANSSSAIGRLARKLRLGGGPVPHGHGSRYRAPIAFDYSRRNKGVAGRVSRLILRKKSQAVSCDHAPR